MVIVARAGPGRSEDPTTAFGLPQGWQELKLSIAVFPVGELNKNWRN